MEQILASRDRLGPRPTRPVRYGIPTCRRARLPVTPVEQPDGERLVGPYLRFQLTEDHFEKVRNRSQTGRAEFLTLGTTAAL